MRQEDLTISCKGALTPEFEKVLQSIPMQKVTDDVTRELSAGNEVTFISIKRARLFAYTIVFFIFIKRDRLFAYEINLNNRLR